MQKNILVNNKGLNLIEIIVVVAVVALLAGIAGVSMANSREKMRDTKRKADISQVGRFLTLGCYMPHSGGGEYDVSQIIDELKTKYPKQASYITGDLRDPSATGVESLYVYEVASDGQHCVLYANLENEAEIITLPEVSGPTMGGTSGVFAALSEGWNGTTKYYQMSK